MIKRITVLFVVLLIFALNTVVLGQSAESFFNKAGNEYIYNKEQLALNTIEQGLSMYSDDRPLIQLKEKILKDKEDKEKEKKDQQKDQQQKQDQQKQDKSEQDKKEQQQKEEQQKGDQKEEQEKGDEQKDKRGQEQENQQSEDQAKKDQQEQENQMPPKSRQEKLQEMNISEEKAKMILEAMRNNEIQYFQQMRRKATKKPDAGKPDW